VAYANYAQQFHNVEVKQKAIAKCTAVLGLLQTEMENPINSRIDETLLLMVLLGLYEVCICVLREVILKLIGAAAIYRSIVI
jgi:hypothetical protein